MTPEVLDSVENAHHRATRTVCVILLVVTWLFVLWPEGPSAGHGRAMAMFGLLPVLCLLSINYLLGLRGEVLGGNGFWIASTMVAALLAGPMLAAVVDGKPRGLRLWTGLGVLTVHVVLPICPVLTKERLRKAIREA